MGYRLTFNSEADEDYRNAFRYYNEQLPGLGDRFEEVIEKKLLAILANPFLYHFSKSSYREASVAGFPYSIVYKVNPRKKLVYISAIHHSSRNPKEKYRA